MLYLLLSVFCSLAISLILKFNETRDGNRWVVAGVNYVVAAALGALLSDWSGGGLGPGWAAFGAVVGGGFVAGFLVQMRAIRELGLAVPISVARIATLGPVIGSVLVYGEHPSALQLVGVGVGMASFAMLGLAQRGQGHVGEVRLNRAAIGLLTLVFCVMVVNDFSMKVVQEGGIDDGLFLLFVFATAALLCWIRILARRSSVRRHDLVLGAALGVPNYFSSYFLLHALGELGGTVVFPTVSASGVLLTALSAILIWKERPSRAAWIGIALAAVAVALMGLGE
jgi:drug/metabolite transporter (DMT)-like permease